MLVISAEDWARIRRLVADGVPQLQVAPDLGVGRSTVAQAMAAAVPLVVCRSSQPGSTCG